MSTEPPVLPLPHPFAAPPEPDAPVLTTDAPAPDALPDAVSDPAPDPALDAVADPAADAASARTPRRRWRGVVRWSAAVAVFAVVGGGVAYGVTQPERTRIPGLHTPGDGRWTYPPIALPKLPEGRPRPLVDANPAGRHYVDIRSLLLPAPLTATVDRAVPGGDGWLPVTRYLAAYSDMTAYRTDAEKAELREDGLRHVAARSWTVSDGTRTDVYLLQFTSAGYAAKYRSNAEAHDVKGAYLVAQDRSVASRTAIPSAVDLTARAEKAPYGPTDVDYAWIYAGDTVALVVQTREGALAEAAFRQTARLQAQLLG